MATTQAVPELSDRILDAAIAQFGRQGFDGASTRDIAKASGTAMSSITYHFGGKLGLYLASADRVADLIGAVHAPLRAQVMAKPPTNADEARTYLLALIENFARFMLAPQSEYLSQFVVREQQAPTEAFERIYARVMAPMLDVALRLVALVRPSLDETGCKTLAMNAIGMVLFLRVARACVSRVMGVADIDAATADLLLAGLRQSALTLLTSDLTSDIPQGA